MNQPNIKRLLDRLNALAHPPEVNVVEWLSSAESSVEFLREQAHTSTTILFASMGSVLIHAVLAPLEKLDTPNQKELSHDFIMPDDSWSIGWSMGGGEPNRVYLASPLSRYGDTLKSGDKLILNAHPM